MFHAREVRSWCARALAGACGVLLVSCGGSSGDPGLESSERASRRVRTNMTADPAMIDPITYSELFAGDVLDDMYESFTALDARGRVIPALATAWEAHDDARGFRFTLREDVTFHSGRIFTAADVKWSLEQLLIPGNHGGLNAKYAGRIEGAAAVAAGRTMELSGITIIDDHTVDIRFSTEEVLFPLYPIFFMDRQVVQDHGRDWALSVSAGTGPFHFVEWRRGQLVRLDAHAAYWGGGPAIDGVDFVVVPSAETTISMYEAGELDVAYIEVELARRVLRDSRFRDDLRQVPSGQINYLGMNQALYPPFQDIRVREAVCLALDRDGMIQGLYSGAAVLLNGQITEGVAGHNPSLPVIPYDPDRARTLMSAAGYPEGQGLPPVKLTGTEPNRTFLAYAANRLNTVLGMPVDVEIVERGTHLANMNAGQVAFFPWGWSAAYPDAMYFLNDVWHGSSPYNRSRWQNDEFDALIEEAQRTPDESARYALYHRAERVLLDDWGTCPTVVPMHLALVKPYLDGVHLTPFRFLPFSTVTFR